MPRDVDQKSGRRMLSLEPHAVPVMAPDRIVVQLGQVDELKPYESGVSLVCRLARA